MENVRALANLCVGRAVFFGTLAISLVMLGFAFDVRAAFRAGSLMTLVMAAVLVWFAMTAMSRPPEKTETWLLLPKDQKPVNPHARSIFCETLRDVYVFYARYALIAAITMFLVSLLLGLIPPVALL